MNLFTPGKIQRISINEAISCWVKDKQRRKESKIEHLLHVTYSPSINHLNKLGHYNSICFGIIGSNSVV